MTISVGQAGCSSRSFPGSRPSGGAGRHHSRSRSSGRRAPACCRASPGIGQDPHSPPQQSLRWREDPQPWLEELATPSDGPEAAAARLQVLQATFDESDCISVQSGGLGGAPRVLLHHPPSGHRVEINLLGGAVTSWVDGAGQEQLRGAPAPGYLGAGTSPPCVLHFPQHGPGNLPVNGITKDLEWQLVGSGCDPDPGSPDPRPGVMLELSSCDATRAAYPHAFTLRLSVALTTAPPPPGNVPVADEAPEEDGTPPSEFALPEVVPEDDSDVPTPARLAIRLQVVNDSPSEEMRFQAAVPLRFECADLGLYGEQVRVLGLASRMYLDAAADVNTPVLCQDAQDYAYYRQEGQPGGLDRLYVNVSDTQVRMCPGRAAHFQLHLAQGFQDVLMSRRVEGLAAEEANRFASLGAGRVSRPVRLAPGAAWEGVMAVDSHAQRWRRPMFEESARETPPMPSVRTDILQQGPA